MIGVILLFLILAVLIFFGIQGIQKMTGAQAELNISEGIKNGKVQTIVVPSNMTALGNISGR